MNTIDKLNEIINNKQVGDCFYNLYDRWRDEHEYEDIKQYGDIIIKNIQKQFPKYCVNLVSSTKRPFGVKIKLDNEKYHIHIKIKGCYAVLSVNKC